MIRRGIVVVSGRFGRLNLKQSTYHQPHDTEEREHEDRRSVTTQTGMLTPGMCIAFSKMKKSLSNSIL
jgi:hypothetical protein